MKFSPKRLLVNYGAAVLLAAFLFISNFLNTNLFDFGQLNFAVWFVLSIFSFSCGWFINRVLGWHHGGKIVFAIIIGVTIVSLFVIIFFNEYFAAAQLLTENIILYSLRNITLGAMGFFGMALQEVLGSERESVVLKEKIKVYEQTMFDAKKEAELTLREAKVKAEKLINDAELHAKNTILKKERIEKELKEFIHTERELIKKYEEL
ncbi:MAG: hypothetical protein IT276_01445 [Ignavibacteriaceae bacterium]|nr:hypothetical protein [Ignavibacteriaceae bacterium]HMN25174.1 hypothetical protein [Ignavibacteriaceae bacterium]HRN25047.1 hypothetical protein [Ignavibacteriaceae bacterium]HRQ52922.1 hypothetical protein [Ignavibacteriaceae bacterium]